MPVAEMGIRMSFPTRTRSTDMGLLNWLVVQTTITPCASGAAARGGLSHRSGVAFNPR